MSMSLLRRSVLGAVALLAPSLALPTAGHARQPRSKARAAVIGLSKEDWDFSLYQTYQPPR